ncbi:MAG: hypothetical protein PVJ39_16040 [Gammaproteobacteria bacterium]|jgi:hypothetical protein
MNTILPFRAILSYLALSICITACSSGSDDNGGQNKGLSESTCGTPPASAFASPSILTALNSPGSDAGVEITNRQLTLYLHSDRVGGYGSNDIYVSNRASQADDWPTPINLGSNINTMYDDRAPTLSSDGLTMIFASDRDGDMDLYMSTRDSVNDSWGTVSNLGDTINSLYFDAGPSLSGDGLTLVFFSGRPGDTGAPNLYITTRASVSDPWSAPTSLGASVNSDGVDVAPDISCDGLRIYFHSTRNGGYDIWMTERANLTGAWTTPTLINSPVSTSDSETGPSISADESTMFFASNRPGGDTRDIWQVTR